MSCQCSISGSNSAATVDVGKELAARRLCWTLMPHYHVNLFNDDVVMDPEGADFADLPAARAAGIRGARDLIAEHVRHGQPIHLDHRIEIASAEGEVLDVIPFREIIVIRD